MHAQAESLESVAGPNTPASLFGKQAVAVEDLKVAPVNFYFVNSLP
jgi:hypothetical protein